MSNLIDEIFDSVIGGNSEDEVREVKVFDGPGRGRKQCPECERYVGVRNQECVCGREFVKGETTRNRLTAIEEANRDLPSDMERLFAVSLGFRQGRFVYAIGNPIDLPIKDPFDENKVVEWAIKMIDYGMHEGVFYTPRALKNVLQHKYSYGSEEYLAAENAIEVFVSSQITDLEMEYNDA